MKDQYSIYRDNTYDYIVQYILDYGKKGSACKWIMLDKEYQLTDSDDISIIGVIVDWENGYCLLQLEKSDGEWMELTEISGYDWYQISRILCPNLYICNVNNQITI